MTVPPAIKDWRNSLIAQRGVWSMRVCADCNPEARGKGELKIVEQEEPSIYVGETALSIYERGKQHWDAWRSRREDSHIYKHMELHHGGKENPNFVFKVVQYHRSALSRQVGEAVRIRRRGGGNFK